MAPPAKLSNNKKRQIALLLEQAAGALGQQRLDICEQVCAKIAAIQPGNADVANIRGIIRAQAGDVADAEVLFVQAINASPKRSEFHENLGKLYLGQKLYADASERYHSALQLNPNSQDIKLGYCASMNGIGQADKALPILEQLRSKHPKHPDILLGLFHALYNLNHFDEALACLDTIIELAPDHFGAHFQRAQVYMQQGRMQDVEVELRLAITLQPNHVGAWANLVEIKKFTREDDADKQAMDALYQRTAADSPDRALLSFALGKVNENLKRFDKAFAFYEEGNAIRLRHSGYNPDAELAHLQAVMDFYTPEVIRQTSELDDERPIFIVGMPRSGCTLVEQILASHPDVSSRGEWNAFEDVLFHSQGFDELLTLEDIAAFSAEQWGRIGTAYLDRLDAGAPAKRITDKTLVNFRLIGAIHCALPHARFVHVRRLPLDNCLSIYRADLRGGQFDFGHNLGQMGYYYRMYQRVMQHWREVLPSGVMYEMDYEQLVASQEPESRRLIAACDLPWDEACLQFSEADTMVATASVAQVRRAMYSDAVARWKRYEKHLQPLIRILGRD